ncbi:MAG: response regulator transcription factor, partial [Alkalibacterium sp.]|uniref:response regulator transcription factor n=1 Tax=Alkalibacterium sp. TaxID=1872447 RepID=UPI0039706157
MKKVLIVEDELSIVKLLQYNLEKENYSVEVAMDGEEGLKLALENEYAIILLDLMLPSKDGMEICKELRGEKIDTPIIMLTAKDSEIDKIVGLEIGADDYITKPFSPREVIARIKAIIRRVEKNSKPEELSETTEKIIKFDDIVIYPEKFEVYVKEKKV